MTTNNIGDPALIAEIKSSDILKNWNWIERDYHKKFLTPFIIVFTIIFVPSIIIVNLNHPSDALYNIANNFNIGLAVIAIPIAWAFIYLHALYDKECNALAAKYSMDILTLRVLVYNTFNQ